MGLLLLRSSYFVHEEEKKVSSLLEGQMKKASLSDDGAVQMPDFLTPVFSFLTWFTGNRNETLSRIVRESEQRWLMANDDEGLVAAGEATERSQAFWNEAGAQEAEEMAETEARRLLAAQEEQLLRLFSLCTSPRASHPLTSPRAATGTGSGGGGGERGDGAWGGGRPRGSAHGGHAGGAAADTGELSWRCLWRRTGAAAERLALPPILTLTLLVGAHPRAAGRARSGGLGGLGPLPRPL